MCAGCAVIQDVQKGVDNSLKGLGLKESAQAAAAAPTAEKKSAAVTTSYRSKTRAQKSSASAVAEETARSATASAVEAAAVKEVTSAAEAAKPTEAAPLAFAQPEKEQVKEIAPAEPAKPETPPAPAAAAAAPAAEVAPVPAPEPEAKPAVPAVPEAAQLKAETAPGAACVIDDFNAGDKPNKLGGDLGAWDKDPGDRSQSCAITYDPAVKNGDGGYSLRIEYDVESSNPAYNGFWTKLQNVNASARKNLVFFVKGDAAKGFTTRMKVELKNVKETGRYQVNGITDGWQKIVVPLDQFNGLTDRSALTELVIVFDDLTSTKKTGVIYIDDICLE